ncbi:MAG TPA: asparagine synthase (glutamine-hydrolyzing), partial [Chryseosolibacter sp.]|nr:asparagine synthase (glutamine-hydrolyzing) [Chryseosolibacter sp.]
MCGITGIFAFNLVGKFNKIHITAATMSLEKRGPDFQDIYIDEWVGLGHRRLSVIDTSEKANQPMWDSSGRYCIVFNGEIFNYRELRRTLEAKGMVFRSESDTEVLLQAYILDQEACLEKLNGFFAFCIYDKHNQSFFLARDRFGVKPLLYLFDEDKFIFASEMKSMLRYGIDKALDYTSLVTYLQLNYIPAPDSILTNVKKLLPGHYLKIESRRISVQRWYTIPREKTEHAGTSSYDAAKARFASLLETAVQRRLVADVPLGAFLSGGVDSSVITGLASRHKPDIQTFSIGFKDAPFFDETAYAREVSKHFNTHHTVFSLTNKDLFAHLND